MDADWKMIAIDTNLLVYAHRSGTTEHKKSQKALERAVINPMGWGIPLPCIAEFWMVVTHPSCLGGASSPEIARRFLESLLESGKGQIWHPSSGFGLRLANSGSKMGVCGAMIFDLQIAMIALENGCSQIWTHDKAFISIPGLRVVDPL
jgi:predicted nucleic acid-binding protein